MNVYWFYFYYYSINELKAILTQFKKYIVSIQKHMQYGKLMNLT